MSGGLSRRAAVPAPVACVAEVSARPASATAGWPSQPIRLVAPSAPCGATDCAAPLVAQGLQERLGQPSVMENRPGVGATLGSALVAAAAPDGHTLFVPNVASHAIAPALYRDLRHDPVREPRALPRRRPSDDRRGRQPALRRTARGLPGGASFPRAGRRSRQLLLDRPVGAGRHAWFGGRAGALSPEEYTAFVRSEVEHWGPLVPASGATVG